MNPVEESRWLRSLPFSTHASKNRTLSTATDGERIGRSLAQHLRLNIGKPMIHGCRFERLLTQGKEGRELLENEETAR